MNTPAETLSPADMLREAAKLIMNAADSMEAAGDDEDDDITLAEIQEALAGPRIPHEVVVARTNGTNLIKAAREARGLSQKALAEKIGSVAAYVSQIETGRRSCSRLKLRQISNVLDIPMDVLDDSE